MRLQILGDPHLMRQIQEVCTNIIYMSIFFNPLTYLFFSFFCQTQPDLAAAAQSDPTRFAELLRLTRERQYQAEVSQQREIEHLNADPFDVEAQHKIEEAIRQQAVMENLNHAIEYSPESFGRVTML